MSDLSELFKTKYEEDPLRFKDIKGVTASWTPPKLVTLMEFVESDATQEEMAAELGFERSTISRKINSMDWGSFRDKLTNLCEMSMGAYVKNTATEYRKKMTARQEYLARKKEISQHAMAENIETQLMNCVQALEVPRLPPSALPKHNSKRTPEHIVLLLSDLHVGLDFSGKETGGLNSYGIEEFRRRAANLQKAVVDIFSLHSKLYDIPELHVFGLGDFVHGTNLGGEWGPAYTSIDVYEQCTIAGATVADLLSDWSKYFKKTTFTGVVGNHGRGGRDKNSDKVGASWDNVAYLGIKAYIKEHNTVQVDQADAWFARKNVNGVPFMIVHGDYISSSNLEAENRRFQDMVAPLPLGPFKYLCLGHFHRHQNIETTNGEIIVNGSWVGGDMYSMQQKRQVSRPTQTIMGIHPDHGITWQYKLDLGKERK